MRSIEDRPDFGWGLYFKYIILWPGFTIVDVIPEVPTVNELLDLILEGDEFLSHMADILVVSIIFVLVPLGVISM